MKRLLIPVVSSFGAGFGIATYISAQNNNDNQEFPFKPLLAATIPNSPTNSIVETGLIEYKQSTVVSKDDLALANVSRTQQIMKHGYPSLDNIRMFDNYVLSYDRRNRVANWVFEHLTSEKIRPAEGADRGKCEFKEDPNIHPFFRSTNQDYKGSGYDRGHLAAAANHRSNQSFMDQTFFLSNMAPQVGKGFNRDKWNELEIEVRKLVKANDNVWVCTGPLYLPKKEDDNKMYVKYEVIGPQNVAVPTHFFKVILCEKNGIYSLYSYVLPNLPCDSSIPLSSYMVPIDSIERAAGFLIFDRMPRKQIKQINGR
ncbi:unnamed protein product [Brachionus calyciflorus]|uniref:Endonuclease n=1 Tax=Brachionus calyciflorus TaxID=104777 RepID=A0A813RDC3_9BILA|nr:unnamed protein product [Brachionus calyciflorus]